MNTEELKDVANGFFKLMIKMHSNIFNVSGVMKGLPIPPSHVKALFYLSRKGACSVSEIAKDLDISKPNMTPIIDKLILEGYAHRTDDPNDRRVIKIELTSKARDLMKNQEKKILESLAKRISVLSPEEITKLSSLTKEMTTIVLKLNEK